MKKLIYILTFTFGLTFTSFAQITSTPEKVNQAKLIKFYPNPATSVINFDLDLARTNNNSLLVFNFMGKLVYETKVASSKITISLGDFYRGIYIVQLRDKNSAILETRKFQVIK